MKGFRRITAIVLICTMIASMGLTGAFALAADPSVIQNWTPMAAKYSTATYKIIAPKSMNYQIKTEGFTFTERDGGISVHTPDYTTFPGGYGTSVLTNGTPTALDGLNVVISPDDLDFTLDGSGGGGSIGILWSEKPVEAIADCEDVVGYYNTGLSDAVKVYANGLRSLMPVGGKALYVSVSNRNSENNGTMTASDVNIVYYDGSYINAADGHPGYRWVFTARNGDKSGIVSEFCEIDITNGLMINVRADDKLGYIVNINGVDYYKGTVTDGGGHPIVAYFPDANTDGTSHRYITDDDYLNLTDKYLKTMTYAKADIDLTGLSDIDKGYLTVGAVSNNDRYLTDHSFDYTLVSVNGIAAAAWKGEACSAEHVCEYILAEAKEANCAEKGYHLYKCLCGESYTEELGELPHLFENYSYDNGSATAYCEYGCGTSDTKDISYIKPYVTSNGVMITVHDLYDVKDLFVAKGEYLSYRELKDAGYIVGVTAKRVDDEHKFKYTVSEPGIHTVVIRYNNGKVRVLHTELTVDEPEFIVNGLQVTIGNIPDVKVIRTAYGEYNTPRDTKYAEGSRNFSGKADIKGAEEYLIQYREEGRVTIVVEYNNGYIKVFHCDIIKKAPAVEPEGNTVVFGNLDGLKVLRYAVGEYSTSAEIKNAIGSVAIKPAAIVEGRITVSGLMVGETYSFCVQYEDESYHYYTYTVPEA